MTEQQAQERGIAYKTGRFPFTASGKATAAGDRDGFVKLLFGEDDTLLGAHMVGMNVTEMIAEPTLARMLGATGHRIARTIHAHPTMNEGRHGSCRSGSGRRDPFVRPKQIKPINKRTAPLLPEGAVFVSAATGLALKRNHETHPPPRNKKKSLVSETLRSLI